MTKKKAVIITAAAIVLLTAAIVCFQPMYEHIAYTIRYSDWEYHMDLAGEARLVAKDPEAAYAHASAAYDCLPSENEIDRGLLSSTCLFMAECLDEIGRAHV